MKVNIVTLGCAKNLVDSEKLLRQFEAAGHQVVHDSNEASDAIIINTCGFVLDAKNESIDTIFNALEARNAGLVDKVYVMGCLIQRYKHELLAELPEVDGFYGLQETGTLLSDLQSSYNIQLSKERIITTPPHFAYLKISEGCDRQCSFCAIPDIRGRQVSVPVEDLVAESRFLAGKGVKELILVAQDLSAYGRDLYKQTHLVPLVRELVKTRGIEWIRLHYTYPLGFPVEDIIALMNDFPSVCRYIDMPFQHVNNSLLHAMKRGHDKKLIENILSRLRSEIPDLAIRSSFITGFPGETQAMHEELMRFLEEWKFDRLGVFTYSHEENTTAWRSFKDDIPEEIKESRKEEIMNLQERISLEKNEQAVGSVRKVIIDRIEADWMIARTQYDSPEVDNEVLIQTGFKEKYKTGDFCMVKIQSALEYDLVAVPLDEMK